MGRSRTKFVMSVCAVLMLLLTSTTTIAETGVTKNEVLVGMSTVLSGPSVYLGTNFRLGSETYLNKINEQGGINGRKIRLIVYDDGYEPARTVVNAHKLIKEDGVFCLLGDVGTPTTVAIKSLLMNEKVPLFAPFTGAESLRNPVSRYLLHYRASYNQEVEKFIEGAVDVLGLKKIAVFYQSDAYGMAVLDATKTALKKRGLTPKVTGTYTRNFEDVSRAFEDIMIVKPQAVVMAGTYSACAKFIVTWKRQYFLKGQPKDMNPVFMNVSFVGADSLAVMLDKYGTNVVVTQVVPPFDNAGTAYPAIEEYLSTLSRYYPNQKPNFVSLEGYFATKVFVEVLRKAGKDLTRESFINAAEDMKNLDIQAGNIINFAPDNHQGSQMVYPTVLKNGRFQLITDWNVLRNELSTE